MTRSTPSGADRHKPVLAYWRVWHNDYYGDDADRVYEAPTRAAARWMSARAWLAAGYDRHRLGQFFAGLHCKRAGVLGENEE